ncbi:hypothetical protein GCM10010833_33650 [Blastomonas aquatica]|uniref:Glycosyl transferase family 1 domain-containing protein n=1 Tax=Blastomonas aquatica TaxID=1510276 RepID=A0ABQ1JSG3_9SPHN|nr:hypothetical protein GCM10010833_33650 [Blastomonas aquatica]
MLDRAKLTLKAVAFSGGLSQHLAGCNVIMARNLEQLAIARRVARGRPIVYECLDIHRSLVGSSAASRAVQAVEALLLPYVDLLLTSSPAFVSNHFGKRPLQAKIRLVENKLLINEGFVPEFAPLAPGEPLQIGWFGMLRCRKTLEFLTRLVRSSNGRIEVLIAGKPSPAELPDLATQVETVAGMRFTGPYRYDELPDLYGQCHFAWTIDWFEEGLNSSWLLPNRLYEALAHGAIPIALADVEVGRWLEARGAGLLVSEPEHAENRLLDLTIGELAAMQNQLRSISRDELVADDRDCVALVHDIAGAGIQ